MKQVLTHGEKKEMKTSPKAKLYARGLHFTDRDAIDCMVEFRIDSHTIKRGTL